jgi:hypothetical protein
MAKFSQALLQGLLQPSFTQELGSAAKSLGATPGLMMAERQRGEQQQEVQQLLQQYANDPEQLTTIGQKYESQGNTNLASMFYDAAEKAKAKQTKKTQDTGSRGKGELMALANNPKFDVTDQTMQSGYFGMADAYGVSREDAMKIALDAKKAREGTGKVSSSRGADEWIDSKGNYYTLSVVRTDQGERKNWIPVTPGAPPQPVGKVTPVGGAYKETAAGKAGRDITTAGGETEAQEYAKLRIEAVDSLPTIERTIYSTQKSLEVLDQIRTGGWSTAVVRSASKFLGAEPKSEAEFNLLAGQQVLAGLNAFEGAISEGERQYLESLYQDLSRSEGANRGILELMLDTANRSLRDAKSRATSNTFGEYMETRDSYDAPMAKPKRKVTFEDLNRGS